MARYRQHFSLLIANILVPVGVVLFIVGFFRGRPPVPKPKGFDINHHAQINLQTAPFDKVIFMMVDALRSDFVYAEGTGFKYTQSLIRSGAAMPFTARAAAPTLTLSRVKALTQGTSQSFLDVWLNVFESESARSLAGADTWLSRLKAERTPEKKMVFYGADLWLDVYSDIFDRFEGTDAWYLPEFTTVDSNVTRHLPNELARDDWKALVLHYLGLDNIAHQGGPTGAHMVPKQAQMDDVVKLVYDALEQKAHLKNTLFVMLGDHGMTDQGNHGGASPSEIAAAMVFVSPKLKLLSSGLASPVPPTKNYEYYSVINQVDFVPTLAGLMGFTTPAKSLGIFVAEFLDLFESSDDRHRVLFNNAQQLKTLLESEYDTTTANVTYCSQLCGQCLNDLDQVLCWLQKADIAQREQTPTNLASMEEVYRITRTFCDHAQRLLNAPPNNPSYVHLAFSAAALVFSTILLWMTHSFSARPSDNGIFAFGLIVSFHGPTMFFNALVLNEQYYWYWASLAWLMYIGYKRLITGEHWLKAIAYPVVLQLISQSLDEATRCGSIVDYVHNMLSGHQVLFWIPGLMIYVSALHSVSRYLGLGSVTSFFASTSICILAILSRLSSAYRLSPTSFDFAPPWLKDLVSGTNRNQSLNIFWGGLGACLIAVVVQSRMGRPISRKATIVGVVELAALYLRSLTRPKYLVLYPIFDLQYQWLCKFSH
ncbi:alkaline phosphatase-like protein, partial [Decorospora gaudefroyi]